MKIVEIQSDPFRLPPLWPHVLNFMYSIFSGIHDLREVNMLMLPGANMHGKAARSEPRDVA
jgi:hypothetical protein